MTHSFVVGKYTLESLTNGMYSSPMDLYREYIQNAVDSIDDAVRFGLIEKTASRIDISVDTTTSTISIKDNGCGIGIANAARLLVDIGNSKKSRVTSRGFRGIGRLAGLGYCHLLNFVTSAVGEAEKSIITFDAKHLKQLLIPGSNDDDSIQVDRNYRRKLRQEFYYLHKYRENSKGAQCEDSFLTYLYKLQGKVAFVLSIDPHNTEFRGEREKLLELIEEYEKRRFDEWMTSGCHGTYVRYLGKEARRDMRNEDIQWG